MQERRETKRIRTALFVRFDVSDDEQLHGGSFTQDVSMGGARLLSPLRLKENMRLDLNIDIPNDPDMAQAEGHVRWVCPEPMTDENGNSMFPVGVEFTYLDRQDRAYLKDFLSQEIR